MEENLIETLLKIVDIISLNDSKDDILKDTYNILKSFLVKQQEEGNDKSLLCSEITRVLQQLNNNKIYGGFTLSHIEEKLIGSFVLVMEARDIYTKGHSQRVAIYSKAIARAVGADKKEESMIYIAGMLHDIGKIGIPDAVLLKPGRLSEKEYEIMKYHPEFSYQILKDIGHLEDVALMTRYHHERCDGSGYPKGLKDAQIPFGSRILAIADLFDALTTNRPYRNALSLNDAISLIVDMKEKLDKEILYKAIPVLKEHYISGELSYFERNFMPKKIDKIRAEIFTKDYMTGLLRRKTFVERVEHAIKTSKQFFMVYVDIKDLSLINYKYSMDIGDRVIMHTANILKNLHGIKFLARTQPDVFYFLCFLDIQPQEYITELRRTLKERMIVYLLKEEIDIEGWYRVIDYYVSFSVFIPGKTVEDMMYECRKMKRLLL